MFKNCLNRLVYVKIIASQRCDVFWDTVYSQQNLLLYRFKRVGHWCQSGSGWPKSAQSSVNIDQSTNWSAQKKTRMQTSQYLSSCGWSTVCPFRLTACTLNGTIQLFKLEHVKISKLLRPKSQFCLTIGSQMKLGKSVYMISKYACKRFVEKFQGWSK